ncbi:glycoside hydrolase [Mycena belliarum]|uniref:glucan 1,3-beta-glucosidase n=1 Tax=Mycena belliarum TaxID=1033014 RepID=A0AAD6TUJ5_9AGAR|nr:glycoside hydrolase [Mycena belliae]
MQRDDAFAPPTSPYSDREFAQPQPAYAYSPSPRGSYHDDPDAAGANYPPPSPSPISPNHSATLLPTTGSPLADRSYGTGHGVPTKRGAAKRKRLLGFGALALVLVAAAVVLPLYFLVIKKKGGSAAAAESGSPSGNINGSGAGSGTGTGTGTKLLGAITGGDGSTVTTASGGSFVYKNPYGGYWLTDPENPFASGARPNSWTPALNESWKWGVDRVHGVNLGGWFVLEPFISPALFQAYPTATDEWSLSEFMRADGTLAAKLEEHYDTFITEEDIAEIAGAGLNWVRLSIPFWAISTWSDIGSNSPSGTPIGEPYLEGVCWKYIVRLLGWARKYGIRVNIDLHAVPGSQNGYNHSGKLGQINFLNGIMGIANAQRTLDYIRIITQFISQPEYQDVVQMFGVINEARLAVIGRPQLTAFYLEVHKIIRGITGMGEGKGPYISIHDGFDGLSKWAGFLPGSDRVILDTHPYFAFSGAPNDAPIATGEDDARAGGPWPKQACDAWGSSINESRSDFGVTVAGEFSNGYNDCGLFLTGVGGSQSFGGDCKFWEDSSRWDASTKAGVRAFALASMDAMRDWFFWTWKIGAAADGVVRSPLWSYKLGLAGGWMPTDPRVSIGKCAAIGVRGRSFEGPFSAWQTGGAGAGTIAAAATAEFGQWPPATISHVDAADRTAVPTYTATGAVPTLTYLTPATSGGGAGGAGPTVTASIGSGWANAGDSKGGVTAVAGCAYPNAYNALSLPAPAAACTGV